MLREIKIHREENTATQAKPMKESRVVAVKERIAKGNRAMLIKQLSLYLRKLIASGKERQGMLDTVPILHALRI